MSINFETLKDYFFHAFRSFYFGYNHPFSANWDGQLDRILKHGELISVGTCTASFSLDGEVFEVWISNRWYGYATLHRQNDKDIPSRLEARPRFRTMRQLHAMMRAFGGLPSSRKAFYSRFDLGGKARE